METRLILEAVKAALGPGRKQVETKDVFNALAVRMPRLVGNPSRWNLFIDLLIAAEAEDLIALPAKNGNGWNYHVSPARPNWIRLVTIKEHKSTFNHQDFPWNPALAFLAGEKWLPTGIREAALSIQKFLTNNGASKPFVPTKERSYRLFGDEKRLDGLQHSDILFGEGKISLGLLRCYAVEPTPVTARFAHGDKIIIVENEATFDTFCRFAKHKPTYQLVIYGRGNEILKCAAYLRQEAQYRNAAEVLYFGDVDKRGLEIPYYLGQELISGPKIVPLAEAYDVLLQQTILDEGEMPVICGWLPETLGRKAATILKQDRQIPQEAFGWEEIALRNGLSPSLR